MIMIISSPTCRLGTDQGHLLKIIIIGIAIVGIAVIIVITVRILRIHFIILTAIVIIIIIIIINLQALCPHGGQDGTCGGVQVIIFGILRS